MNKGKMNNTLVRILTAIIGIPLIIYAIIHGGIFYFLFAFIINAFCQYEMLKMFERKDIHPLKTAGIILSSASLILYNLDVSYSLVTLILSFIILAASEIFRNEKIRNPLSPVVSLFSFVYITMPMLMLLIMENEYKLILTVIAMIWINDSAAFFTGKSIGRHKLTSASPNKTIEGFIGGVIFTFIAGFIVYNFRIIDTDIKTMTVISLIVAFVGTAGDIFESLLKRYTGIKDSSNIIPGHGGVLDRFDSLIFIIPVLFVYIRFLKILI